MGLDILYRKLKRNYVDHGLGTALRKGVQYLARPVYDTTTYRIYGIDLRRHTPRQFTEGEFTYRMIGRDDTALIEQVEGLEEWLQGGVAAKLQDGGACIVALDGETVAGFNLVAFGKVEMPLVKTHRDFGHGNAWSEQITVNSRYRGKGLGADLRYRIFAELKEMGVKRFYGGTLSDNEPNLKLTRKVGFTEIADIRYCRRFAAKSWSCVRVR
jgi:RimJ/RimL family protein N-acetyltransferase